eukprot:Skav228771  [mRNA]  locus=scaffold589:502126:503798:- [translate_table: standard]
MKAKQSSELGPVDTLDAAIQAMVVLGAGLLGDDLAGFIWLAAFGSKTQRTFKPAQFPLEDWNFHRLMMNFFARARALALLALLTVTNCDPKVAPDLDQLMTDVDTDKDGKISWDEVKAVFEGPEHVEEQYKVAFKECDDDKDGFINREELPFFFEILEAILHEEDKAMGSEPKKEEETEETEETGKPAKDEM